MGAILSEGLIFCKLKAKKKNNNNKKAIDAKQLPGEQRMY